MDRETTGDSVFVLRTQLMPILRAYGVEDVEVAYSIGTDRVVEALQFRDSRGFRIPRGSIPERVTSRVEACIAGCLAMAGLGAGSGVVTLCVSAGRVVRRHQLLDDETGVACEEWTL
jgi:hypothetical protein